MLSTYIKHSLTSTFLEKFPSVEKALGLYEDNNITDYFNMKNYVFKDTNDINLRFPLYRQFGNKDLELTSISNINISGQADSTDDAVPFIAGENLFNYNVISQYLSLKPIIITIDAQYHRSRIITSHINTQVQQALMPINALADTLNLPVVPGVTEYIDKTLSKYRNMMSKISDTTTKVMSVFETFKNITNEKDERDITKLYASVIALQQSRITIDLDIGCFIFKNMFLQNFNIDRPKDENNTFINVRLVFKSIPIGYMDRAPQILKNGIKQNKDYGYVSMIPYQNIKQSIKKYILLS